MLGVVHVRSRRVFSAQRFSAQRVLPFVLFGAVAITMPAIAQTGGSTPATQVTPYPACTTQPTKDDSDVAHGAYIAGKRAFDENDYPTAIQYFRDALRRDCTKYELLNIISRAFELKGDKPEAINALEAYLKRAPANDPNVEPFQRRIASLKAQVAADASNKAAASASAPTSAPSASSTASAAPTSSATTAPPAADRGHTIPPWIVAGAGVALIGVGVPLAIIGQGQISDPAKAQEIRNLGCNPDNDTCPPGSNNESEAASIANRGTALRNVGFVMIGVGAAAVIGGLVWHFVEPTGPATPTKSGRVDIKPETRPGYAGVSLVETF